MGGEPGWDCQGHRCTDPGTLHATPQAHGPRLGAEVPVGSQRPAPELGISTSQLRRLVAAAAFLLGPPEGGASEREALPAASRSLGQVC